MKGTTRTFVIALAMATMFATVATGAAVARGAGGDSGSTIRLVVLNGATEAHYGGQVTFNVSTSATKPWVNVDCYRNGVWLYTQYQGFFAAYDWSQIFTLGPTQSWTGGDADCTARLFEVVNRRGKQQTLATTGFHVYA